jgi:hypothetical protein
VQRTTFKHFFKKYIPRRHSVLEPVWKKTVLISADKSTILSKRIPTKYTQNPETSPPPEISHFYLCTAFTVYSTDFVFKQLGKTQKE